MTTAADEALLSILDSLADSTNALDAYLDVELGRPYRARRVVAAEVVREGDGA